MGGNQENPGGHLFWPSNHDLWHKIDELERLLVSGLATLTTRMVRVENEEKIIMATIADIQTAVTDETTVVGSVVTLLNGLSDQLAAAIASQDPVAMQAVLDGIKANTTALAAAVVAKTSAAPTV